jgi:hypothetical protein
VHGEMQVSLNDVLRQAGVAADARHAAMALAQSLMNS